MKWQSQASAQHEGRTYVLDNGSSITLNYLDTDADIYRYQGAEMPVIGVDELTQFPESWIDYLITRNRTSNDTYPVIFMAGTNPGGIGHGWVKKRFIDPVAPEVINTVTLPDGSTKTRVFIPAKLDDHPNERFKRDYNKQLQSINDPQLRKALRDGDWNTFAGQVFTEFSYNIHVVTPFEIPSHWQRWKAMDHGNKNSVGWFARNPENDRVYMYREYRLNEYATIGEKARTIRQLEGTESISFGMADPSIWATGQGSHTEGKSIAELYLDEGVSWQPANNDRRAGLDTVHKHLAIQKDGYPKLLFFSNCVSIIKTLPSLPYDKIRVDDVDTKADDHDYDMLRYALMAQAVPANEDEDITAPEWVKNAMGVRQFLFIGCDIITRTKDGVVALQLAKQPATSKTKDSSLVKGSNSDTLKFVLGMHKEWKDYKGRLLPDWERDTKLYNNERVTKNRYEGVSDTFVPMPFSTVETMVAALATGDLSTDFIPQDIYKYLKDRLMPGFTGTMELEDGTVVEETEEQYLVRALQNVMQGGVLEDEDIDVLNALYDYFWYTGDWDRELEYLIRDGLKVGIGGWWLTWTNGKPCLETVPFPDFIFDPKAKEDESAKFFGRRYLADLKDLQEETIVDVETGKTKKRYKGLNKVEDLIPSKDKGDKNAKELLEEMLYGSTVSTSSDDASELPKQVEVIEILTADNMYTVVNRRVLAESTENPYKAQARLRGIEYHGIIPGITWANYKDKSLLVGKSEIATFWQEAERLNDVTNQKSDAVTRALLQQKVADPQLKSQSKSMNVPGAVIWGKKEQYQNVDQAQVPNVAFNEEASIKNNIREVTATDQIVKGVGSSEDITATEAKLQVAQSGQRIELKIKSLERGPLKRLARLTLQMIQLFVTDPFIVPYKEDKGIKPLFYNPSKYQYDFEPRVKLTIDAQVKQRQERQTDLETYQILIADPTNNLQAVKELYLPKITGLDKDQVNQIASQPELPASAGMQPDAMALPPAEVVV